ncbi:MAG: hypothetical protein ACR2MN_17380 [Acidimicrobiales bacterium]
MAAYPEDFGGMRVDGEVVIVSFTSDLDRHLRGLRASVEYPELVRVERAEHPLAQQQADIGEIYQRLRNDPRRPLSMSAPGRVHLRAPFVALAAELHRKYGSSLEINVGHKPYPPERIGDRQPVPVPTPAVTVPGLELTVTVDEALVAPGEDFGGRVVFSNRGSQQVLGMTGVLTGGVRAEGDEVMAGNLAGAVAAIGQHIRLDPGASMEMSLTVGTASCLPDASYVVPPGRYEVVAAIPFNRPGTSPTLRSVLVARGTWVTVTPHTINQ